MSKITGNEPVHGFGYGYKKDNPNYGRGSSEKEFNEVKEYKGMTLRQYYAGQQLAACRIASPQMSHDALAQQALLDTDFLIEALNKNNNNE